MRWLKFMSPTAATIVVLSLSVPQLVLAQPTGDPPPAAAAGDADKDAAYGRHMDNGLKLYSEGHNDPAVAEFEAAYAIRPNASPLINIALCYKKQARYAEAIAVLERARRDHHDSMKPEHHAAVDAEIKDMKALLAYLQVAVEPAAARVLVDGRTVESDWRKEPLALSPGSHIVRAEAAGYRPGQVVVRLVSGNDNEPVKLKLEATLGTLEVRPISDDAEVSLDGVPLGKGSYSGSHGAGVVEVTVKLGAKLTTLRVVVTAGATTLVEQQASGALQSSATAVGGANPMPGVPGEDDFRHFFLTAHIGLLTASGAPDNFTIGKDRTGFGVGGSGGYLLFPWFGLELMGQYSDIRINGDYLDPNDPSGDTMIAGSYRLQTFRGAALLRFNLPAKSVVRFAGAIGPGFVVDRLTWDWDAPANPSPNLFSGSNGFKFFPYGQLDLGVEVEFEHVLAALVLQTSLHSTKHIADSRNDNPFEERAHVVIGPLLRAGYSF